MHSLDTSEVQDRSLNEMTSEQSHVWFSARSDDLLMSALALTLTVGQFSWFSEAQGHEAPHWWSISSVSLQAGPEYSGRLLSGCSSTHQPGSRRMKRRSTVLAVSWWMISFQQWAIRVLCNLSRVKNKVTWKTTGKNEARKNAILPAASVSSNLISSPIMCA